MRSKLVLVMLVLGWVAAQPVLGQGQTNTFFQPPPRGFISLSVGRIEGFGARAFAMGGAFIAVADDATAVDWNPAGLAQLPERQLQLGAGYLSVSTSRDYGTRTRLLSGGTELFVIPKPGDSPSATSISATSSKTHPDFVTFAQPFNLGNGRLVLALSASETQAALDDYSSHQITPKFTMRYAGVYDGTFLADASDTTLRNEGTTKSYSFSFAYNSADTFLVGVTVSRLLSTQSIFNATTYTNFSGTVVDQTGHTYVTINPYNTQSSTSWSLDSSGWTGTVGIMWKAAEWVNLGATYHRGAGLSVDYQNAFTATNTDTPHVSGTSHVDTPSTLGVGVAFRPRVNWTVAVDYGQSDWSNTTLTIHSRTPGLPDYAVYYPSLERVSDTADYGGKQFKDTVVRIGTEYILGRGNPYVPIRAGLYREKAVSGVSEQGQPSVTGYTLGFGIQGSHLFADLTAVYEKTSVDITNTSEFQGPELLPYGKPPSSPSTWLVQTTSFGGSGRFEQKSWRAIASVGYRF